MSEQLTLTGEVARPPYRDEEYLRERYHEMGWSLRRIARDCDCHFTTVLEQMEKFDIPRREAVYDPGKDGYAGFYTRQRDGYEFWKADHDVVLVHRLVAVAEFGFEAVAGGVVHHGAGEEGSTTPWDNRPGNLRVFDGHREHNKHHARPRTTDDQTTLSNR